MALLLELIFLGYLLVRKYGGPGSDKLAARSAIFGMANVPFVYDVGEHLADDPSADDGGADAAAGDARRRSGSASTAFMLLFLVLLTLRVNLEQRQRGARRAVSGGRGLMDEPLSR